MAGRRVEPILAEIVEAMDGIEAATKGKSIAEFKADWLLRHGVQRGIEIISEAARHLPDERLVAAPEIPWKKIRGIGNLLRHEYHKIADEIIWAVIQVDLPGLRLAVERIQKSLDAGT